MECRITENKKDCPCKSRDTCPRNSRCCECIRYHISKNSLTSCMKKVMENQ